VLRLRAGATLDLEMDTADSRPGRKVACPALVLWGGHSHTARHYGPREVWPRYCSNIVRMQELPCGHYPSEASTRRDLTASCSASSALVRAQSIFAPERRITSPHFGVSRRTSSRNASGPAPSGSVSRLR